MAMIEISTALASAKAAFDLLKTSIAARDEAKIQNALSQLHKEHADLAASVMAHIEKSFNLQSELHVVRDENRDLKSQLDQRDSYDLFEISPGKFCYKSNKAGAPLHYLCQPCWDKKVKSVLQQHAATHGWPAKVSCSTDNKHDFYLE